MLISYFRLLGALNTTWWLRGFAANLDMELLCSMYAVADAGFCWIFHWRVLFGIRMLVSELAVWAVAILLTLFSFSFIFFRILWNNKKLTRILHVILLNPYPYWSVICSRQGGRFLSFDFADEPNGMLFHHKDRGFFHSKILLTWAVIISVFYNDIFWLLRVGPASLGIDAEL